MLNSGKTEIPQKRSRYGVVLRPNARLGSTFDDSVIETLCGILGQKAGAAVFDCLEREHSLARDEYFEKVTELNNALRAIFGANSVTVEKSIAKCFYGKLGLKFIEWPQATLTEYVEAVILNKAVEAPKTGVATEGMSEVKKFAKGMKPQDHVILFYSSPIMKRELLFSFLKDGLENGEAVTYVTSQETPEQIMVGMRTADIDVEPLSASRALHVYPQDVVYYIDGHFDSGRTKRILQRWHDEALRDGFKRLRPAQEVSCFFEHGSLSELVAYEQSLHREPNFPVRGICAYDVSLVPIGIFNELIAAHSNSVFLGPEMQFVA